jgi:heme a synthase
LLFCQLTIAAVVRHSFAGMAIPSFPHSTPAGGLLPDIWNFQVAIQFAHRVMAVLLSIMVLVYGHFLWRETTLPRWLRACSLLPIGMIAVQIYLGAQIIWTGRSVAMTTGHVVMGAATLASTFLIVFLTNRESIEGRAHA